MSVGPLRLAFYKGLTGKYGAIQFNPQFPHYYVKREPSLKNFDGRYIPENWLETSPELTDADLASREGAIFLEITSAKDKNVYDWARKIVFALSITDIAQWIEMLEGKKQPDGIKLMHDPGAKSERQGKIKKYLEVKSPQGLEQGVIVTASEVMAGGGTPVRHTVPLSSHECTALVNAMKGFVAKALGWI
jgi:hypothetical protein